MADLKPPQAAPPEHRFVNVAQVRHSQTEFYLEFGQFVLNQPGVANLMASLVMTPQHAKLLLRALAENLGKFESKHGEIELPPALPKEQIQ